MAVATAKARHMWCPSVVKPGASGPCPSSGAEFVEVKEKDELMAGRIHCGGLKEKNRDRIRGKKKDANWHNNN